MGEGNNILQDWQEDKGLEPEKLVESDLKLSKIRNKISHRSRGEKIDLAYRLAAYTSNREPSNLDSSEKLNTIITRQVKLIRLYEQAKQDRGYTEVEG